MYKKIKFLFSSFFAVFIYIGFDTSAIAASVGAACYPGVAPDMVDNCVKQPEGLRSEYIPPPSSILQSGKWVSSSTWTPADPNDPCCLIDCISTAIHATINGNFNCYCRTGHYKNGNDCTPCAEGSYQNSTGQTECKVCGAGKTTNGTGKTENADCVNCPPVPNMASGKWATPTWMDNNSITGLCEITECIAGYHPEDNNKCEGNKYTVKFDVDGGEPKDGIPCTYGSICDLSPNPTKSGHTFKEWTVPAGNVAAAASTATSSLPATGWHNPPESGETITLTAVWQSCDASSGGAEWDENCNITKCKPGYRFNPPGGGGFPYDTCTPCNSLGKYCDGTNTPALDCGPGWYCPIYDTPGTILSDCTDSTDSDGVTIIGFPPTDGISAHTGKCKCPAGATSGAASESIESCFLKGGPDGTKFCDSESRCFYLPSDVPYRIN